MEGEREEWRERWNQFVWQCVGARRVIVGNIPNRRCV